MQNQHKNKLVTDTPDTLKMYTHTQEKKSSKMQNHHKINWLHWHTYTHTHTHTQREGERVQERWKDETKQYSTRTHTQLKKIKLISVNFCSCYS